jgi:hypothetical protein
MRRAAYRIASRIVNGTLALILLTILANIGWRDAMNDDSLSSCIREEKLLQLVVWKMVHFALFLVQISIILAPVTVQYFFSSQCTSLLYKNFKILVQCFNE